MKSDILEILKKTKFSYLLSSQVLSQVTINMMNFLLLVKIYENTNSTFAISLLWISYALPVILVGPIASALVDIMDRRKVLMASNLLQALIILYYAIFFRENIFLLYGITFFYSFINQFYVPAESASISHLVKKEQLPYASGMFYSTQQLSIIVGFALSSIFNRLFGFNLSLYLCSFFLAVAFICVTFLPKMHIEITDKKSLEESLIGFFKTIYSGYKYIRSSKNILITFLILISVQIMFSIIMVSVPMIGKNILNIEPNLTGIFIVIPAGIGSLLGAFNIPSFLKNKWRKKYIIETSLLIVAILIFLETYAVSMIPYFINLIVSSLILLFLGVFFSGIYIPSQTFLQEQTHDEYKGRIFGNMSFVSTFATIIPLIFYGAITEMFGIKIVLLSVSLICFLMYTFSRNGSLKLLKKKEYEHGI